jgi:hypothetical protein
LHLDTEGNLWVERALSSGSLAIDVFSPTGQPLARLQGDLPAVAILTATHVYGLVRGSEDVSALVAFRIER